MQAFRRNEHQSAIAELDAGFKLLPHDARFLYFKALALWRMGERQQAQTALEAAVKLESEHPVKNYGRLMERIQGAPRVWLEKQRRRLSTTPAVSGELE
jgi:hypothetical protein